MIKKTGLLMLVTFLATACPKQKDMEWENIYWTLTSLAGEEVKMAEEEQTIFLHLPEGPNGKVEGFAGCNRFFGSCEIEGDKVQFSRMASTKMMCPGIETERAFLSALEKADVYRVKKNKLELLSDDQVLASFTPSTEKP